MLLKLNILFLIFLTFSAAALDIPVHFTLNPPQLDGILNDTCYQKLKKYDLNPFRPGQSITRQTEFRIFYSIDAFYIAVDAFEPTPAKIKCNASDNGAIWEDDSLEIFFSTDNKSSDQYLINAIGKRANRRNNHPNGLDNKRLWNWQAAVKVYNDRWTAEIRIPYQTMTIGKDFLDKVKFNIGRNSLVDKREFSTFAPVRGVFRDIRNFANLKLIHSTGAESIPARYEADKTRALKNNRVQELKHLRQLADQGDVFYLDFCSQNTKELEECFRLASLTTPQPEDSLKLKKLSKKLLGIARNWEERKKAQLIEQLFRESK